jgi:AraC-like DNA-binding protein
MKEAYPKAYLYRRIVRAKLFIDKNFSKNIDLNNISGEAYISKYHFVRQFRKVCGKTPHQYLIKVRMEKAMHFLRCGMPVSDVCLMVGFESLGSFSSLFKRQTGLSPSVYLAQQRKIKALVLKAPLKVVPGCFAERKPTG